MKNIRVLWFSVTPSQYGQDTTGHNGGGWISSLENLIKNRHDVELGVAFEHHDNLFKVKKENVVYYPIKEMQHGLKKIIRKLYFNADEKYLIPACLSIIDDFKPDIIQVFGSEWCFGLLSKYTTIPLVIHMQGSIPAYYNARFPAGYSKNDFIFVNGFRIDKILKNLKRDRNYRLNVKREENILKNCKYFIGRTEWDKNITQLYAPNSTYYYCSEAIRSVFMQSIEFRIKQQQNQVVLVSVISSPLYKGADTILKAAELLQKCTSINFIWKVFGIKEMSFHERKSRIKCCNVNVKLMGTVTDKMLLKELINANIFIHTSYIENSPNSVCEAQLLGIPVICTNVGGTSSLIKHKETGLLFPANDPFTLVSYIKLLLHNIDLTCHIGKNARKQALIRHNPNNIINDLLNTYYSILIKNNQTLNKIVENK